MKRIRYSSANSGPFLLIDRGTGLPTRLLKNKEDAARFYFYLGPEPKPRLVPHSAITFSNLAHLWLKNLPSRKGLQPSTLKRYREITTIYLAPIIGKFPITTINGAFIKAYLRYLYGGQDILVNSTATPRETEYEEGLNTQPYQFKKEVGIMKKRRSKGTIKLLLCVLKKILRYGTRYGIVEQTLLDSLPAVKEFLGGPSSTKESRKITEPEVSRLLEVARKSSAMVYLYSYLTLRLKLKRGEALGLKCSDIAGSTILVQRSIRKGEINNYPESRRREVPLDDAALDALKIWKAELEKMGGAKARSQYLFPSRTGATAIDGDNLKRILKPFILELKASHEAPT